MVTEYSLNGKVDTGAIRNPCQWPHLADYYHEERKAISKTKQKKQRGVKRQRNNLSVHR